MPIGLSGITAATMPQAFRNPRGETFTVSPLELIDLGAIDMYLASLPLEAVKFSLRDMPTEAARYLILAAYAKVEAAMYRMDRDRFLQFLATPHGVTYALWLAVRRNHPAVTLEQVQTWVTDKNFAEVLALVNTLAGVGYINGKKAEPQVAAEPMPATSIGAECSDQSAPVTDGRAPKSSAE